MQVAESVLALCLAVVLLAAVATGELFPLSEWTLCPKDDATRCRRVTVPSTVLGGLVNSGAYDYDPLFGKNMDRLASDPLFMQPWVYRAQFSSAAAGITAGSSVFLRFNGINYRGNLTVNNHVVAMEDTLVGAFRRFEFDITRLIQHVNTVVIALRPPRCSTYPGGNNSTDLSLSFVDWNADPPDRGMGLWRPVEVVVLPRLYTASGLSVNTTVGKQKEAFLNASFVLHVYDSSQRTVNVWMSASLIGNQRYLTKTVTLPLASTIGQSTVRTVRVFFDFSEFPTLVVPNAPLWYPFQMGEAQLHDFYVGVFDEPENGTRVYTRLLYRRSGIREVKSRFVPFAGKGREFLINGNPFQVRGGGWTPEMFLRSDPTYIRRQIQMVRHMGMNAIRLEGKLESEEFFDACDELGIVVLPGWCCCDAWQHWGAWKDEQYYVAAESTKDIARVLSPHPSVIVFFYSSDLLPPAKVENLYLQALADEAWCLPTISSASGAPSPISGRTGVKMSGPYSWVPPHYWLEDDGSRELGGAWSFLTEGGPGESPMTYASWKRTVPAEHLWNATAGALDSWWSYHCGHPSGTFRNLRYFDPPQNARYGAANSAEMYLYISQAMAYEGIRSYFEAYSRNKNTGATGFIQWLINGAWPNHIWHLYDYYLVAGGGYYGAKKACENLHVMWSYNDSSVWLINSAYSDVQSVTISASVLNSDGEFEWGIGTRVATAPSNGAFPIAALQVPRRWSCPTAKPCVKFIHLEWEASGTSGDNWYWVSTKGDVLNWTDTNFCRTGCSQYSDFTSLRLLPPVTLSISVTREAHQLGVNVTNAASKGLAFFVSVRVVHRETQMDVAPAYFDDNYFTLEAGATKHVNVVLDETTPIPTSQIDVVVDSWNSVVSH